MYKLIAHRGDKKRYSENTLLAFKDAIKNDNYVGFECDVRQTKDNKYIIYHDPLYKGELIKNMLYEDFDLHITLEDVLNLETDKIIIIDIKDPFMDTKNFIEIINNSHRNIYVISFYQSILNKLYQEKRNYKLGLLNYFANNAIITNKYDFECLLGIVKNEKLINKYRLNNKVLFFYGISMENVNHDYPFYIVD